MSETFERVLVKDDRLGCISPKVKYQVLKGGQNITCQAYNAISQSTTNHVYNAAVPSLETFISREVLWKSTVSLKIATTGSIDGYYTINYGVTDALAPFPLHNLVDVMSAPINNNTVFLCSRDATATSPYGGSRRVLEVRLNDARSVGLPSFMQ